MELKPLFIDIISGIYERRWVHMATISLGSIYYAISIAFVLCSAAYKIGYEIGKNERK
jgi:hypothetical protein